MKSKTIKAVIRAKVDAWIASIEDEQVRALAAKSTIVTGGAIASMLLKELVNDFDVYFRDRATTLAVAKYYVGQFCPAKKSGIECAIYVDDQLPDRVRIVVKSAGVASENGTTKPYEYFESQPEGESQQYVAEVMDDPGNIQDAYDGTKQAVSEDRSANDSRPAYRPVFLSTNAITLSDRVQLVLRFYGEPEQIHENYDFVHCTNYWTSWDDALVLKPSALEALLSRELVYVGSRYPVCSIIRLRKFIKRGWTINAGQMLKMVMQVSALDLTNIEVLQDQLTGVDCAYFCEVISKLKEKDPTNVNAAYLVEIIDRMF
jgi:hypothetical protein